MLQTWETVVRISLITCEMNKHCNIFPEHIKVVWGKGTFQIKLGHGQKGSLIILHFLEWCWKHVYITVIHCAQSFWTALTLQATSWQHAWPNHCKTCEICHRRLFLHAAVFWAQQRFDFEIFRGSLTKLKFGLTAALKTEALIKASP